MRLIERGRFLHPPGAAAARGYMETTLTSHQGRLSRLRALVRPAPGQLRDVGDFDEIASVTAGIPLAHDILEKGGEWLALRDYGENARQRSLLFFFERAELRLVVKIRSRGAAGESLVRESEVLQSIADVSDETLRLTIPRVLDYRITTELEMLALSPLPGRSLDVSMQRSLRPHTSHGLHLTHAGRWLGLLHASTRSRDGVAVHGDFWPRNILLSAGPRLSGVVDWEQGAISGSPWEDLFTLPILFATAAPSWRKPDLMASFRRAFAQDTALAGVISGYLRAYGRASGAAHTLLRARFHEFLHNRSMLSGKEVSGWQSRYPWAAMLEVMAASRHSVFSG